MPAWQGPSLAGTGCSKRASADIAAAAAFARGGQSVGIDLCVGGQMNRAEGTSASSPMLAAMFVRLGISDEISKNLGWIYQSPTGWNDLGSTAYPVDTTGNLGTGTDAQDDSSCGKLCKAGPGWDGPSGVGTPNGTVLATFAPSLGGADAGDDSVSGGGRGGSFGSSSGSGGGAGSSAASGSGSSSGGHRGLVGGAGSSGCNLGPANNGLGSGLVLAASVLGLSMLGARRRRR
jgi:hypothetical protein